jgi:tetratricopeptide (TPR) repeat protein
MNDRNEALDRAIKGRGWIYDDLADRLQEAAPELDLPAPAHDANTVGRWVRGERHPRGRNIRLLCHVFRATPVELGLVEPEDPDLNRRHFLEGLAGAGLLTLGDPERLADTLARPARVTPAFLEELACLTRLYAHQAQRLAPATLLPAVADHLARIRILMTGSHPESAERQLQLLAAEASIVAGRLAFWRDDHGQARAQLGEAVQRCRELNEPHLLALALALKADLHSSVPYLGTTGGSTMMAIDLFSEAIELDSPNMSAHLRAWLYGCRAEEYAVLKRADDSDRDMDAAHQALAQAHIEEDTIVGVARAVDVSIRVPGLSGFEGAVAVALERGDDAVRTFQTSLGDGAGAGNLSGLAAGYALQGEVERAADLLTQALESATERGLHTRVRRVEGVRQKYLPPAGDVPAVRRFDERLRALTA